MKYTWGIKNYDDILTQLQFLKNNITNLNAYEDKMTTSLKEIKKRKDTKMKFLAEKKVIHEEDFMNA